MIEDIKKFVQVNRYALAGIAIVLCVLIISRYGGTLTGKKSPSNVDLSADSSEIDSLIKEIHEMQAV